MPKASDNIKIYRNPNGPVVSTVNRRVLEQDGLTFKDIDGTGTLSPVNDWRNSPAERAAAYVKTLSVKEKIAQLFISDWRMAKYPITGPMAALYKDIEKKTDETGILDEGEFRGKTIFGEQYLPGTSPLLKDWFNRHVILRANATPADLADWMNQADAVCEECEHFIPVAAASNSRNENGELVFGMNDAGGVLATWPGTLGIAAAVKGSKIDLVDKFADTIRREWNACGLRKGYMYMADAVTDPRWQRTYGTFGEDPALISEIMAHIIPRIQGSDHGVTEDGVAVTTKHFPGGGARENGFDPHYAAGQWNVYATPGSLETYHLPPFAAAVKAGTSSIMPYYSKPAAAKSAVQHDLAGNTVEMKPYGFAYNKYFIDTMLRGQMGFDGYINSDTGIAHNMAWGVEMLDVPERIGFAVANAGVDIIDAAFNSMSGLTSQPALNSIVAAMDSTERETGIDPDGIQEISDYWAAVRPVYAGFESDMMTGSAEIYKYEMPGGQYSNLKSQVESFGLGHKFNDVKDMYKAVNEMLGDIVKVTPSSKAVGDMAIFMVQNELTPENIYEKAKDIDFPDSIVSYFEGMMGQPEGGFPEKLQKLVLHGKKPITCRPGELLPEEDFDGIKKLLVEKYGLEGTEKEALSYALYPKVFEDYLKSLDKEGDFRLMGSDIFFHGLSEGETCEVKIAEGKELVVRLSDVRDADDEGFRNLVFEVNGNRSAVKIKDQAASNIGANSSQIVYANAEDPNEIGANIPGNIIKVLIAEGDEVEEKQPIAVIEAMKMETNILAPAKGVVDKIYIKEGQQVKAGELIAKLK